ncbi:hypothetical protein CEP52_012205 [Fusarium oligoseptatum]|uniref:Uncharacterized protein n=1 Tax=Fusarium oligoseptatum TaxID=2604345 RepID=A0A428SZG4_9HYPO|nr:hypothetical protein CEP52_012205 [Fusarium oligoseptatum]
MPTIVVRATYTEQNALETFFTDIFGWGTVTVFWKRGTFQCSIPRQLTDVEKEKLQHVVSTEGHY